MLDKGSWKSYFAGVSCFSNDVPTFGSAEPPAVTVSSLSSSGCTNASTHERRSQAFRLGFVTRCAWITFPDSGSSPTWLDTPSPPLRLSIAVYATEPPTTPVLLRLTHHSESNHFGFHMEVHTNTDALSQVIPVCQHRVDSLNRCARPATVFASVGALLEPRWPTNAEHP